MKACNDRIPPQTFGNKALAAENLRYANTGGVSENNRARGFIPAFLDTASGQVYRSRFPDGRPAPVHMLSGLPARLFIGGHSGGQNRMKDSVISGFLLEQAFYTRKAAAIALQRMH